MSNTLTWGFYWNESNNTIDNSIFFTHINYHRLSIKKAIDLGYECHLYIQEHNKEYFLDISVKIHLVNSIDTTLFDWIKHHILCNKIDTGILIDGDVILNSRLPNIDADIIFERYETNAWKSIYGTYVDKLTSLNIQDIIPEWSGRYRSLIMNIGLFKINNEEFKSLYLNKWNRMNQFIKDSNIINKTEFTATATQYLLTELTGYYNMDIKNYYENSQSDYIHYLGNKKFKNKLVPNNKLLLFKQSII